MNKPTIGAQAWRRAARLIDAGRCPPAPVLGLFASGAPQTVVYREWVRVRRHTAAAPWDFRFRERDRNAAVLACLWLALEAEEEDV